MPNRDLLQCNRYKPIEVIDLEFAGKWLILVKPEGEVLGAAFIPNGEGAEILPLGEFRKDFVDLMLSDFQCAVASNAITVHQLDWIKRMHRNGRFLIDEIFGGH